MPIRIVREEYRVFRFLPSWGKPRLWSSAPRTREEAVKVIKAELGTSAQFWQDTGKDRTLSWGIQHVRVVEDHDDIEWEPADAVTLPGVPVLKDGTSYAETVKARGRHAGVLPRKDPGAVRQARRDGTGKARGARLKRTAPTEGGEDGNHDDD